MILAPLLCGVLAELGMPLIVATLLVSLATSVADKMIASYAALCFSKPLSRVRTAFDPQAS